MLTVLKEGEGFCEGCALVLGGFDGLHLGHRALLSVAVKSGLPVGITSVLSGKGRELFTREERNYLFSQNGVRFVLEFPFTEELKNTPAEEFLKALFGRLDVKLAVCGEDFRFGKGALGTAELLKTLAPCPVEVVKTVGFPEEGGMRKYSSTACKAFLERGDLSRLNACLSASAEEFYRSAYFIGGTVEHGRQVGRTYGFPTLNLSVPERKLLPPDGVNCGLCATPKGNFPTIVNIGARPTFGVEERKIEAYLDGFSGDLYGEYVRVFPTKFLRPIYQFSSVEELKKQLLADIRILRKEGYV